MVLWLAENAVVTAVMAVIVVVLCRVARPRPSVRHALWLVVLVKLITPPVVEWPWSVELEPAGVATVEAERDAIFDPPTDAVAPEGTERPTATAQAEIEARTPEPMAPEHVDRDHVAASISDRADALAAASPASAFSVPELLFAIWVAGLLGAFAIELVRWLRLRRMLSLGTAPPAGLRAEVERCAERLRMRTPRIRVLDDAAGPFVCGLVRPTLYWPAALIESSNVDARRGVLTHELAHLRRGDHLYAWIEMAAGLLFWWNPLVAWMRRRMREAAEWSCDAWVVRAWPEDRRQYAEALLDVTRRHSTVAATPVLGMTRGEHREFQARLLAIVQDPLPTRSSKACAAAVAGFAILAVPGWSAIAGSEPVRDTPLLPLHFAEEDEAPFLEEVHRIFEKKAAPQLEGREDAGITFAIVRGAELLHLGSSGTANADATHDVGSIGNAFAATLAAQLRDGGKLALDDPLVRHLAVECPPEPGGRSLGDVTLRHLLHHTSGLPRETPAAGGDEPLLRAFCASKLQHAPGVEFVYSRFGYALLGRVLERAADKPYPDLLEASLTKPLGMKNTRVLPANAGYGAADGVVSTARDLARFVSLQLMPAETIHGPVATTTVGELQQPRRIEETWLRQRSLAWEQVWNPRTRVYLLRASRSGDSSTLVAFSAIHKVGVVLLGRNVAGIEGLGSYALELAVEEFSDTMHAEDLFGQEDFAAAIPEYERLCAAYPEDGQFRHWLGYCLLVENRNCDAIDPLRRAYDLGFKPATSAYNLACAYGKLNEIDKAFPWLEKAIELGFRNEYLMQTDPDIASLRADPRYAKLRIEDY